VQARDRVARPELAHEHRPAVDVAPETICASSSASASAPITPIATGLSARAKLRSATRRSAELVEERGLDAVLVGLRIRLRRARAAEPDCEHDGQSACTQPSCHTRRSNSRISNSIGCQKFHFSFT